MYLFAPKRNEVSGEWMASYNDELKMYTHHFFVGILTNEGARQEKHNFEVGTI
jgi:hypothetical protein